MRLVMNAMNALSLFPEEVVEHLKLITEHDFDRLQALQGNEPRHRPEADFALQTEDDEGIEAIHQQLRLSNIWDEYIDE